MLSPSMRVSPGIRAAAVLWGVAVLCGVTAAAVHEGGTAQFVLTYCLVIAFGVLALVHLLLSLRHGKTFRAGVASNVMSGYASLCIGLSMVARWEQSGRWSKVLLALPVLMFCFAAHSLWTAVRAIVRGR